MHPRLAAVNQQVSLAPLVPSPSLVGLSWQEPESRGPRSVACGQFLLCALHLALPPPPGAIWGSDGGTEVARLSPFLDFLAAMCPVHPVSLPADLYDGGVAVPPRDKASGGCNWGGVGWGGMVAEVWLAGGGRHEPRRHDSSLCRPGAASHGRVAAPRPHATPFVGRPKGLGFALPDRLDRPVPSFGQWTRFVAQCRLPSLSPYSTQAHTRRRALIVADTVPRAYSMSGPV